MGSQEFGLYYLAETLGAPLYELKEKMPMSEYSGWIKYYAQRREQEEVAADKDNLLADPNRLLNTLT